MKPLALIFLFSTFAQLATAENLTSGDREALLEKLEKIRNTANTKVDDRFKAAMSAFKSAMGSDDSAVELYLKCEEMVSFDEMKKKSGDFRDWKRVNAERLSDKDFKLALRQQLRWLVLTLEAASKNPNRDQLAIDGAKILESIVTQAKDLSGHRDVLLQNVTDSVFARAYDINGIKLENWPLSPVMIQLIYERVLLPPLRSPKRLPALKSAWTKRMIQESTLMDLWSGAPGEKLKAGIRSPEYDKFVTDTIPKLQWASEVDLFEAGDQRAAALRMLAHIEKNITHEAAPQWATDFRKLLQGESKSVPGTPALPADETEP